MFYLVLVDFGRPIVYRSAESHAVVEILDGRTGKPIPDGEWGKVLTNRYTHGGFVSTER
jgi:phenylacetate-coenzyme A ligase PaaK-like adenylate-forming protein